MQNMILFNDFKKKYKIHKKEIDAAINRVLKSGWFILGGELKSFEENFSKYLGVKYVVGVNSGTDAIFLGLKALGIKDGDEVITVANTATPTIAAIRMAGGTPVFVDIDENTINIDPDLIKKTITKKTKAILPVHLFGYPAEMDKILKIAKKYKLKVIEDSAQAVGARFKNKMVGTFGDVGCFSFYPTKNLGAFGDAGAIVTNNKKIADKARQLRNYGEASKNNNVIEGVNSRLDEFQAGILNWGLQRLDQWNKKREKLAKLYIHNLQNISAIKLPADSDKFHKNVWHLFVIGIRERGQLQDFLLKNKVQTAIHYPKPIYKQPVYKNLGFSDKDLPKTKKTMSEILSLPLNPELEEKQVNYICDKIKFFYANK